MSDGSTYVVDAPIGPREATNANFILRQRFIDMINDRPDSTLLEIGSRGKMNFKARKEIPNSVSYVGIDIKPGENVSVVADAHFLPFCSNQFDFVFSGYTIEHIAMLWKLALEINKVLKRGGCCFIMTHQSWQMHQEPWDYWRFSDTASHALFNKASGFEIIEAALGEPARLVPEVANAITVSNPEGACYRGSAVLAKKISSTVLGWDVNPRDVMSGQYPG